jgi:hypothetical protein
MADKSIREQESELFQSMTKVRQPMAPDSQEPSVMDQRQGLMEMPLEDLLAHARTIDWYRVDYEFAKRTWPSMSDEDAHRYAMGDIP